MILINDALRVALVRLKNAKGFLEQCKKDGDYAVQTGALRDAREGLTEAVEEVIKLLPPEAQSL